MCLLPCCNLEVQSSTSESFSSCVNHFIKQFTPAQGCLELSCEWVVDILVKWSSEVWSVRRSFTIKVSDKTLGSLILAVRDCAIILTVFHEQWLRNLRNVIVAWKISWDRTQFFSFRNLYITVENLKMITSAKLRSKKALLEFKELSFKGAKWMHTTMNVHCSIFSLGHTSLLFFNVCIWNKFFRERSL